MSRKMEKTYFFLFLPLTTIEHHGHYMGKKYKEILKVRLKKTNDLGALDPWNYTVLNSLGLFGFNILEFVLCFYFLFHISRQKKPVIQKF